MTSQPMPPAKSPAPKKSEDSRADTWQIAIVVGATIAVVGLGVMMGWSARQPSAPAVSSTPAAPSPSVAGAMPARPNPARLPADAASSSAATPKWTRTRGSRWASDGSRTISYELEADNDVNVWMKRVRPVLAVRCLARQTEVFVVTDTASSIESQADRHTVRLGFDDEPDVTEQWLDSTDHRELFAPDGMALAKRVAAAQRMRFGFTPFNAAPVVAEFNVRGFSEPLELVARMCGWGRKPTAAQTRTAKR